MENVHVQSQSSSNNTPQVNVQETQLHDAQCLNQIPGLYYRGIIKIP